MDLSYIIKKIKAANFSEHPFKHIEINDLFEDEDFEKVLKSPEISIKAENDTHLFEELFRNKYRVISFPGCTDNFKEYIEWHKNKKILKVTNTACEGYGVVLRLEQPTDGAIKTLFEFINSKEFVDALAEKFGLDTRGLTYDAGIQKYLDGYEISPHPDIRKKALTYMVNINPGLTSDQDEHHTRYLHFKPEWNFVKEFWKGNEVIDRCWVPWSWCETKKQQRLNNSIVIFAPDNDTMHAVKANYNHLLNQRTQLYGNLWYNTCATTGKLEWEDFMLKPAAKSIAPEVNILKKNIMNFLPSSLKDTLKSVKGKKSSSTHGKRNI